jgi:hypothetical protein
VFVAAVYFYNTVWFQAFFMHEKFYKDIAHVQFDVTQPGEKIEIPLKFKYKTCYDLGISVPGAWMLNSENVAQGQLAYSFMAGDKLLARGIIPAVKRSSFSGDDDHSIVELIVFDLPFAGESEVVLHVEVIEPFSLLSEFKGHTSIVINLVLPPLNRTLGCCH